MSEWEMGYGSEGLLVRLMVQSGARQKALQCFRGEAFFLPTLHHCYWIPAQQNIHLHFV